MKKTTHSWTLHNHCLHTLTFLACLIASVAQLNAQTLAWSKPCTPVNQQSTRPASTLDAITFACPLASIPVRTR